MRRYLNLFFITFVLLSLVVTSLVPPHTASASPLQTPAFTITMTDALLNDGAGPISPDEDGDGKADPGETIEYTAVIQNSGADPATGVTFSDILDINTTLVGGSLNVSPLAVDDIYETIGNTLLDVGLSTSDPAVHVTTGSIDSLFDNDTEFLGDSFTLKSVGSDTTAPFTTTSEQGGTVSVESDGNFSYLPAVGFSGTDHFDYVITDDGPDNIPGNVDDLSGTGRVTITVIPQRVWYVKNDAAPGGLGRSTDPFDTLVEAQAASADNDTIYVFQGNGTTAGQNAGITLKNGQRLLGEGVALTVPVSVNSGPNPTILRDAGSQPLLDNTGGFGVSVSDSSNVQIFGLNIAGSTNAVNVTTTAANSGGFELANNTIRSAGTNGIDVNGGGSGILIVSLHDNTVTATGNGIDIQRTAGSVNVIAFDDNVVHGNTSGIGINIIGTGATILFDTNPATAAFDTVSGGITHIGQSGNGVGQSGFVLNNIRGDLSFTDLDVYAEGGTALLVNGTSPNYTGTSGTRVVANSNTPVLSATGGPAANLTDVSINLVLNSLSSTNSTSTGVSLLRVGGTFSAPSGSSITNAVGVDFSINGNSNANANVGVSYAGTVTDTSGMLVQIQNVTASSTHTFSGAITDSGGTSTGISLTGNTGATVTFSGGLVLSTGTNAAFTATGGGTVNICDENPCNPAGTGSVVNTLTATTGTALHIANTNIGSNKLEFRSINVDGNDSAPANGIVLNNTGGTGGLIVKGTGSAGSGGTIRDASGDGILLTSTAMVSLSYMGITSNLGDGIGGSTINGFQLNSVSITNNGNDAASDESGINITDLLGTASGGANPTSITNTTISNNNEFELQITNSSGTLTDFQMSGNTISSDGLPINGNASSPHGNLVNFLALGSATMKLTITSGSFTGNWNPASPPATITATGVQCDHSGTSGTMTCNISGSTFTNNNVAVSVSQANGGNLKFTVNNNMATGNRSHGLNLFVAATGTGTVDGAFTGNTVGTLGTAGSGANLGFGIRIQNEGVDTGRSVNVLINNNTVQETSSFSLININQGISGQTSSTATNATITGNTLKNSGARAIIVQQNNNTDTDSAGNTCVDISSNTMSNIPGQAGDGTYIRLRRFDANSTGATFRVKQTSLADLASQNSITTGQLSVSGTMTYNGAACTQPSLAMLPGNDLVFAQNQDDTNPVIQAQVANTNFDAANAFTAAFASWKLSEQTSHDNVPNTVASASTGSSAKPLFTVWPVPAQSGETISVPAFTLPADKSVIIKFRVTVNSPSLPLGTTQISNQGTVESNELGDVQTDDPSAGGGSDPTVTLVDRPDTTITSINRIASSPTNAVSVSWTVTFADAVSGLMSSNFTLVNGGLGGTPAITVVTPVGGAPATQWTVTASTGTGEGTLGLNITNDTGLSHDMTNLTFTGQGYTVERTPPTVTMSSAALNPTNTSPIPVTVQFSEMVNNFIATDIVAGNATVDNFIAADGDTYTFDLTPSGQGLVTADIAAGVATDVAGNNNAAATQFSHTFDNVAPSATLSSATSNPTNASPIPVTVQFSENVSGFAQTDIVAGNATVSNFIPVDSDTYTFDLTPSGQGSVTADIAAGVANDVVGNGNIAAAQFSRTFDSSAPTLTVTSTAPDPANTSPIPVTIQFSEDVSGFTDGDVTAANATIGNFIALDGDTYTFDLTPSAQGVVTVDIAAGMAQDGSGNGNSAATQFSRKFDSIAPIVTMTSAASDPTNSSPILVTAQFSEQVTGFLMSDITAGNATMGNFNAVDGDTYTFEMTPLGNGPVTADIAAGVATDGANLNSAASQFSRTFDSDAPTVTITSATPNLTNTSPIHVTVQFSEDVTGFDVGDVTEGNATVGNFVSADGATYTFDLTPLGDGLVTADIPAGVAQDSGGNDNTAATQFSRTFDTVAPSATIDQTVGQVDPTSASPINFTVVFSEPVTGFGTGDVDLGASTATGTLLGTVSGGPIIYNVTVSGMTSDGMVIAHIAGGVATDGTNLNTASTSSDNSVLYVTNMTEHMISGNVGVSGAVLSYMDGNPKTVISEADGSYSFSVSFNWTGTVTPTHTCYTFSPLNQNYSNVFIDQTAQDYTPTFDNTSGCADIDVSVGGVHQGQFMLPPQGSMQTSFAGISTGPVNVESTNGLPFLGMEQVIYEVNGTPTSFSEMMGLPDSQLDTTYWLPWYNNVGLDTQLRIANVSGSNATVRIYIAGQLMPGSPFTLLPGESTKKSFLGVDSGPVRIESTQNIVAAERVMYKVNGAFTSFSEMMALPNTQLDNTYWLPWYNNIGLDTQLRIANVSSSSATVRIYIGGQEMQGSPFTLGPGASTRKSFPGVDNGPVKIESTQNIVAAERVIYKVNGVPTSFSEMMGLPDSQLDTTYWLPWYNNADMETQLRFANVSGSTATLHVYIGGVEMAGSPFTLLPDQSIRVSFPGVDNGPVKIESDVKIVTAKRVIYKGNGLPTSFSELMALPNSQLDTVFWLPWYNNVDLGTRLQFVVP